MIEQIEAGEMPPKNKPHPSDADKSKLLAWVLRVSGDYRGRGRAIPPRA